MHMTRLFTGDDGQSHFEDIDIELEDHGIVGRMSALWQGSGVIFREVGADYDYDFHTAPRRQFIVNLDGWVEIEVGDGTVRRFGPGTILLADDLTGQGHISRAVDDTARRCLVIPLEDG